MFTGIIEQLGTISKIEQEKNNLHFFIKSQFLPEIKVDQSISHNGVCLTVVEILNDCYKVTAIQETLLKTNLQFLMLEDSVNLERCMRLNDRLDGHLVQGHVDTTGRCIEKKETNGSWEFRFDYNHPAYTTVEKGSISVNGVSLTVVESNKTDFTVAIIPYTYYHTCFQSIEANTIVNLEFDIIGKYIAKLMKA
jgi:riboflavin synthase